MVELIIGIIVVIALILLFIVIIHNKFQFAIIEIEEAENNIDILLHKKKDLLNRSIPIIRKELKMEDFLKELDDKKDSDINLFDSKYTEENSK